MQKQTNSGELAPQTRDLTSLDQLQTLEAKNHKFSNDFDQRKAAELSVDTRMKEMRKYAENGIVQPQEFIDSFDHLSGEQKEYLKKEFAMLETKPMLEKLKYFLKEYGKALIPAAAYAPEGVGPLQMTAITTMQ
jgi:hypothetical protein